jgi:hypothetical protein
METENKKKNIFITKGANNWVFIVAVALFAGAVGGALMVYINDTIRQTDSLSQTAILEKSQTKPIDSNPSQAGTDFSGWQTYRDDKCGYEIKYPQNFQPADATPVDDPNIKYLSNILFRGPDTASCTQQAGCFKGFSISCFLASDFLKSMDAPTAHPSLQDYITQGIKGTRFSKNFPPKTVIAGNLSGIELEEFGAAGSYKTILFQKGDRIIQFNADKGEGDVTAAIDQMIPTFKIIEPQAQVSADMQKSGDSAIKPIQLSRDFDSRAVFGLFNDYSNDAFATTVKELHGCGDALDCQAAVLKKAGASNDAIEFYRQSDGGVMYEYKSYGYFALVNVSYPFAANDNDKYMILSGKNLWVIERTEIAKVAGNENVAKEFPSPDDIWFQSDQGSFIGQNKSGQLVFAAGINAGCHICATGYAAIIGYKVNPEKDAVSADLKGFCTQAILIDGKFPVAKYPACSTGIDF